MISGQVAKFFCSERSFGHHGSQVVFDGTALPWQGECSRSRRQRGEPVYGGGAVDHSDQKLVARPSTDIRQMNYSVQAFPGRDQMDKTFSTQRCQSGILVDVHSSAPGRNEGWYFQSPRKTLNGKPVEISHPGINPRHRNEVGKRPHPCNGSAMLDNQLQPVIGAAVSGRFAPGGDA